MFSTHASLKASMWGRFGRLGLVRAMKSLCVCVLCVRGRDFLCCLLGEAGSPSWMGARSQSHTARLFVVEGCTGRGCAWSRSNMAAVSEPSREAQLWTSPVNRADGHFGVFSVWCFKEKMWERVLERKYLAVPWIWCGKEELKWSGCQVSERNSCI